MWWSRFFKNTPLKFFKQGDARPVHRRWIRLCRHTCCDKGPRCLWFHPIDRQVSPTYEKQIELIKSYVCYYFLYMHSKMNNGRNEGYAILTTLHGGGERGKIPLCPPWSSADRRTPAGERNAAVYTYTYLWTQHICTCDESKDNEYHGILITLHRAKQFIFVRFLYILPLLSKVCLGFLKREQSSF